MATAVVKNAYKSSKVGCLRNLSLSVLRFKSAETLFISKFSCKLAKTVVLHNPLLFCDQVSTISSSDFLINK